MRDAARIAYAQARAQARFGDRPEESLWRELEAGRDLQHLIEMVRGSLWRGAVESLPASVEPHQLESRLRAHWEAVCAEVARWYPAAGREARPRPCCRPPSRPRRIAGLETGAGS